MRAPVVALLLSSAAFAADWPHIEVEVQQAFDGFVDRADEFVVEIPTMAQRPNAGIEYVQIRESRSLDEIRSLKKSIRMLPLKTQIRVIDGKETEVIEASICACYGDYRVTLKKEGEKVLRFSVAHGESIKCRTIADFGEMPVDPKALAPLETRMKKLMDEYLDRVEKNGEPVGMRRRREDE
jgi:hypothetical protein